jgi:hypothetical protein
VFTRQQGNEVERVGQGPGGHRFAEAVDDADEEILLQGFRRGADQGSADTLADLIEQQGPQRAAGDRPTAASMALIRWEKSGHGRS